MSQSAFSFWRDRDEEPEDKTQGHSNTQSPVLKSTLSPFRQSERNSPRLSAAPPSRLLVSPSGKANQLRNDYPLRPRPRVSPTVSSSLKPRSPVLTGQTAVTSVKTVSPATRAKVPLIPPPSKLRKNLLDGPIQSTTRDTSAKRVTQDDSSASFSPRPGSGVRGNKEAMHSRNQILEEFQDQKGVSDIIGKLNLHSLPATSTKGVRRGPNQFLLPPPHTAPVTSTRKKFLLPPRGCSLSPAEIWKERESKREERGGNERTSREETVKEVQSDATRRGRQAAIRDELKSSMRLKSESGISVAEIQDEVKGITLVEDAEGEEMREDAVENKNLRVSQPINISKQGESGSLRIRSTWKCYLDGPEEVQTISPNPSSQRPIPSPIHTTSSTSSYPALSTSPSPSLVQTFSEAFRTSSTEPTYNYFHKAPLYSKETLHFWKIVDSVRKEKHAHCGHLHSPLLSAPRPLPPPRTLHQTYVTARRGTAAKNSDHMVTVSMVTNQDDPPASFQCSAQLTVCEVIKKGVAQGVQRPRTHGRLWLKVCGRDEYLDPDRRLVEYVYVHKCLKLFTEVKVQIINRSQIPKSLMCEPLQSSLPPPPLAINKVDCPTVQCIGSQELNTLLDSYITKEDKFRDVIKSHGENPSPIPIPALVQTVISCVKLLCERLLYIEPPSLSEAVYNLSITCKSLGHPSNKSRRETEGDEVSDTGHCDNASQQHVKDIVLALNVLRVAVYYLVSLYCLSLCPGYLPEWWVEPKETVMASSLSHSLRVKVCALHRIPVVEYRRFIKFQLEVCVYHGGLPLSKKAYSPPAKTTRSFFSTVVWNKWLNFGIPLSHLPRESRLCFTLHGLESTMSTENPWKLCPIAWVTQRLFSSEGVLIFGPKLLGLWAGDCADPLDSPYSNISSNKSVLLEVVFEESDERVMCDVPPSRSHPMVTSPAPKPDVPPSRSHPMVTSPAPKPDVPPSRSHPMVTSPAPKPDVPPSRSHPMVTSPAPKPDVPPSRSHPMVTSPAPKPDVPPSRSHPMVTSPAPKPDVPPSRSHPMVTSPAPKPDVPPSRSHPMVTSPAPKPDVPPSRSHPMVTPPAPKPVLPPSINRGLKKMADRDRFSSLSMEDEKLIWTNRFLLQGLLGSSPRGLPLLLHSTPNWHSSVRDEVWTVLRAWPCSDPVHGLELLDAQLADSEVRKTAVCWLSGLPDDDLCDFLPQLVQSVRHDCYEASAMSQLLLTRAFTSPRIAHHLYWHLYILAKGQGERFSIRYQLLFHALQILVGERLQNEFNTQVELVEQLVAVAGVVKATRDAHRQTVLVQELQRVEERFVGEFRLPLSPSLLVRGLDIESSSFFNSNTVPLKLSFLNSDPHGENVDIIFKVGDDLRQDILVLQMIKVMEKIWIRAGFDLKMITYDCVATGPDQGMLEVVTDSATLRTIQTEHGITGSFKDKPLSNWLMRYNPTDSDYKRAVDNFTCSCAGYCVATYVLGICDRHNDNIMVKTSGHMFHIDFGKILGNAQMFGSIKRDRVPFVLTRDMAYVINDGDMPTSRFQQFVDVCCTAYNELRRHTHTLLSLLSLMLSSGLPELSSADDILYVRDALLPGRSDAEATYAFTKHIEDSLGSVATQINFFIHNLAQHKFSSPQGPPTLLTFVPQAYSIETDGKIQSAVIVAYYKRYYPDTYTVYQIQVTRQQSRTTLFRRYREFCELHNRLLLCFPGGNLPNFPGKTYLPGKSHAKETVERRVTELNKYVNNLLEMETKISESDVVYTFFHCLIRDEQDKAKILEEGVNEEGAVAGRVKVHLTYDRRSQSLSVMIRHVKDLVAREGSYTADPYVKVYLHPDPNKTTKQKTKVAKRTLHPTYNETFTYKVPTNMLSQRTLELSVWDASILLSKQCLAVATIELSSIQSELSTGCSYWVELHSPTHIPP